MASVGVAAVLVFATARCTDLSGLVAGPNEPEAGPDGENPAAVDATGDSPMVDGGTTSRYAAVVLADAPIAYWRLGEAVGPMAKDEGTSSYGGIYKGGVMLGVPGAIKGDPDTAAQFDGVDDVLEVAAASKLDFAGTAPFSVEAWVKRTGMGMAVLGKSTYEAGPGYRGWFLVYNVGANFEFWRGGDDAVAVTQPPDGTFFHTVTTFDGFTLLLFVNGAQVAASTKGAALAPTGAPLLIGRADTWGTHTGVLDEIALYDKALAPARIRTHYEAGIGK